MLDDGISAAARQADVEHNRVETAFVHKLLAFLSGGSRDDGMPSLPEARTQKFNHARVVFDDEDAEVGWRLHTVFPDAVASDATCRLLRLHESTGISISGFFYRSVTGSSLQSEMIAASDSQISVLRGAPQCLWLPLEGAM